MRHETDVTEYEALVFDCDGVVLDSNKVKTQAFYKVALPYGEAAAQALVDHHVANGGISRYKKFAHFIDTIVPLYAAGVAGPGLNALLESYATSVRQGLLDCSVAAGLQELRAATPEGRWLIVSGGDQAELREVFAQRGLITMFDGGVFGSPDTKDEILARETANGNISTNALFIGDSRYDHVASSAAGLDFVFVSQWTEFAGWQSYCETHQLSHVPAIHDLLPGAY
jgi:phosphoglycolate phosphatase-like HAD superfamily hydrolase